MLTQYKKGIYLLTWKAIKPADTENNEREQIMTIHDLIAKRDELTSEMAKEGNHKYWENEEVNRIQREINELAK